MHDHPSTNIKRRNVRTTPIIDRLMGKVRIDPGGCWVWTGALKENGYGTINRGRREMGMAYAHRVSYEHYRGPIPDGLHIDHLCRNRACVNPDHLEAVTNRENLLRGNAPNMLIRRSGACARGHEYDEVNSLNLPNGQRQCRACWVIYRERRRLKAREAAARRAAPPSPLDGAE